MAAARHRGGPHQVRQPCAKADAWLPQCPYAAGRAGKASGSQAPGPCQVKTVLWLSPISVRSVQDQRHPWLHAAHGALNQSLASAEVRCEPLKEQSWLGDLVPGVSPACLGEPTPLGGIMSASSSKTRLLLLFEVSVLFHPPYSCKFIDFIRQEGGL